MEDFYLINEYSADKNVLTSTSWPQVDLFSHWNRRISFKDLSVLLSRSWDSHPHDTIKLLFYLRNFRGGKGKGEKYQFYQGVRWFIENHPEQIFANFKLIPEFGYWKDLLNIWDLGNELLRSYIVYVFCNQLQKDLHMLGTPSLAAKWAPTEKGSADRKWGFVNIFCEQLGWSKKTYRQNISKLRNEIGVTERFASDKRWGEMDFEEIPVKSRLIFHNTLEKYCGKRYTKWCDVNTKSNDAKSREQIYNLITTLCASEYKDDMWEEITYTLKGKFNNALCVCDVSPSMNSKTDGKPINIAMALSLLINEKSAGPFCNKVLPFTENPSIVTITGDTFTQKCKELKMMEWGYSIDLAILLTNLANDNLVPEQLFIFTDNDFNYTPHCVKDIYKDVKPVFDRLGLVLPKIYFWNLGHTGSCSFNLDHYSNDIIMIRGFTSEMFNTLINTGDLYPWILLKKLLSASVYSKIKKV